MDVWVVITVIGAAGLAPCGCTEPSTESPAPSPVFLLDTELLDPPAVVVPQAAVEWESVFKPSTLFDIDEEDPSAGRATGFILTLATRDPEALQVRLWDLDTSGTTAFEKVASPASGAESEAASHARPFNSRTRDLLGSGVGVYWHTGEIHAITMASTDTTSLEDRFTILIPETLLTPFTRLDMFTDATDDGIAFAPAEIELVQDFFYMAIIGDSVLWGNGLREEGKMSALTAGVIERETGRKVIQQRHAQSGAAIVPAEGDSVCEVNCIGEAPTARTSITVQADLIESPELMDLILMDGCTNDIGVGNILDPEFPLEDLADSAVRFCRDEMMILLQKVRSLAPQARIVVTGYYQYVGLSSDPLGLRQWSVTHSVEPMEGDTELINLLTDRCAFFVEATHENLREAIETVNAETAGDPAIGFADPFFGPDHAVSTDDPWLFSMTSDSDVFRGLNVELDLFPEDPLLEFRISNCLEPNVVCDFALCVYNSVGHPNPTGARVYADTIVQRLRELDVLPAQVP